jgi:hypothetical protein
MKIVYELIGYKARIDWASSIETNRLGLFEDINDANKEIEKIKQYRHWRMDWDSFEIKELKVR